jgi:hypothetical protein
MANPRLDSPQAGELRSLSRRGFLLGASGILGMLGMGSWWRWEEWQTQLLEQQARELEADSRSPSPRLEATRLASQRPGPAEPRLQAMGRLAISPAPHLLPWMEPSRPWGGISLATHALHWRHHYLEYLWRWNDGLRERDQAAEQLAHHPDPSDETGRNLAQRVILAQQRLRQGAIQVLLHELYWEGLLAHPLVPSSRPPSAWLAKAGQMADDHRPWIGLWQGPSHHDLVWGVFGPQHSFPSGEPLLAVLDAAHHAWALDHGSVTPYLGAWQASRFDRPESCPRPRPPQPFHPPEASTSPASARDRGLLLAAGPQSRLLLWEPPVGTRFPPQTDLWTPELPAGYPGWSLRTSVSGRA